MSSRIRVVVIVALLCASAAGCGTRVDEAATTAQTIVVANGAGQSGGAGSASSSAGGTSGTSGTAAGAASGNGSAAATTGGGTGGTDAGTGTGSSGTGDTTANEVQASGDPIVLGAVGTRSGIVGAALENSWRGLAVWQEWVNAHGGVQGRPVKVISVDDGGDPGKHAAAVRRLIYEDHVIAFVGDFAPLTLSAGIPLLEQNGVATIGGDGGDAAWFGSPMAFPINGQEISRSRPAAKWILANRPERKAAVFYVNEVAAPGVLAHNFSDEWQKDGGQVVVDAGVSLAQIDFTSEVIQAKNAGADAVFLVLEKSACNRFLDAARRQSYTPIWIAPACTTENARDASAITTNKFFGTHAARPVRAGHSPAEDEALEAIAQYDPSLAPDGAWAFAWLGGKLFEAAMAQPGAQLTSSGVIDALHSLPPQDFGGLSPTESWGPGPHAEVGCGLISEFDGHDLVVQTPDFLC